MKTLAQRIDELESEGQRHAVREYSRSVVLARPGSGKTHTLVLKVAYLLGHKVTAPQKVACITYMNDAVSEIYERLETLGIEDDQRLFVGTLHRFCFAAIIHPFKDIFLKHLPSPLTIADEDTQKLCWAEAGVFYSNEIFRLKRIRRDAALGRRDTAEKGDVDFLKRYRKALHLRGLIDFDDVANYAFSLVRNHAIVRSHVIASYPWLVIDEYQDLGEVFNALVQELIDNTGVNFCIVGDPNQSIMGFQGAAPAYLRRLANKPGVKSVHLSITRRCFPQIISLANRLSEDQIEPHSSFSHSGREPRCIYCPKGFQEQVEKIVQIVAEEQRQGTPFGQIAVLCRSVTPPINEISSAFVERSIPFAGSKDQRYERTPLIRLLEDAAAWAIGGWKNGKPKFERILRQYRSFFSENGIDQPFVDDLDMQQRFFHVLLQIRLGNNQLVRDWLDYLASSDGLYLSSVIAGMRQNERYLASSFEKLVTDVSEGGKLQQMTIADFALGGRSADSVFLSTLHSSKGLEFETVIIPEMEQGVLPDYRSLRATDADREAQIAEERRLLYVGITRARANIYFLYSGKYVRYGGHYAQGPSQFLHEIGLILDTEMY